MINIKGQGSVELLIGLGVILIILLGFITLAQEGLRQAHIQKDIGIAERTVNEVSEAVETVCHQGIGARKQVFINIPDSTNLNESYIGKPSGSSAPSKMISLNLRGTDIFRTVGCEVKGNWPDRTGNDWINIESKGDYVLVGQGLIDVDKNSVYFLIPQNTTRNDTIKVTNIYDDEINVTITKYWVHSIGLAISPTSFSFDPDDEQNVNVQISASNESSGIYNGYILFNATSGNKTEEIKTYITVEIRVSGGEGNATTYPSLRVIPNEWNETMNQSEHKEKEFIICTNSNSSFNTLSFTPSSGNPGDWVGNTGSIGPIGTDDCKTKTLWLDIPANQSGGDYSGYINVTGSGGSPTYTTNITLNVHVNDVAPPNITFVPPTDCNVTITTQNWTFINVSLSENPDWIRLEWNGTNETMNGGGTNWYKNMTNLANGNYTFKVYANDSSGNMGVSQTCWVNINYVTGWPILPPFVDVALAPIDNNKYAIAWVNANNGSLDFRIMGTNGNVIVNTTNVDTVETAESRVSVTPIDSTQFVVAWTDGLDNDARVAVYKTDGTNIVSTITVDDNLRDRIDISVAELIGKFVVCYVNDADNDADFKIYNNDGTLSVGETKVDSNVNPDKRLQNYIECSGISNSRWVYFWDEDNANDATFSILNSSGSKIVSNTDVDTNIGNDGQVAVTTLDNDKFAMVWFNSDKRNIVISIRNVDGSVVLPPTDIDTNVDNRARVAIGTIKQNSGNDLFVVAWYTKQTDDIRAAVYYGNGTEYTAPFVVDNNPKTETLLDVTNQYPLTNNHVCPGTFIIAYTNSSNYGVVKGYYVNGTEWNGNC